MHDSNARLAAKRLLSWMDANPEASKEATFFECGRIQGNYYVELEEIAKALRDLREEYTAFQEALIDLQNGAPVDEEKVREAGMEIAALNVSEPGIEDQEFGDRCGIIMHQYFPFMNAEGVTGALAERAEQITEAIFEAADEFEESRGFILSELTNSVVLAKLLYLPCDCRSVVICRECGRDTTRRVV